MPGCPFCGNERLDDEEEQQPQLDADFQALEDMLTLDNWASKADNRYYETDKMGFDAVGLGVGRQWRCNCYEVICNPGREPRKVHVANGLSYSSAADARKQCAAQLRAIK